MTLKEFKESVLQFIEEYDSAESSLTKDVDISSKIDATINNVMFEVSRYKKIEAKEVISVEENEEKELSDIDDNCYQIKKITGVSSEQEGNFVKFKEEGEATVYYYKYPKAIKPDTDGEKYKFELDPDALEVMKIGVAAKLLKTDVSNQYGKIWENEYIRLLQTLDSRKNAGIVVIRKRS